MTALPKVLFETAAFAPALQAIADRTPVVLVVGRAGTGKTTLVRDILLRNTTLNQAVVAPTGVAALQARGQTIHSFFQIPPQMGNLSDIQPIRNRQKREVIKKLDRLIVDEVSMVRADLLDKIDQALKVNRNSTEAFGGVQMVLVGDFYQLPPVVPRSEAEILKANGYAQPFAPFAKSLDRAVMRTIELTRIFRQSDPEFIELLGHLRAGTDLARTLQRLNEACFRPHRPEHVPVLLTGRNAQADAHNTNMLAALPGQVSAFEGETEGEFNLEGDNLPAPQRLELKSGARVMLLRNDTRGRWVNGTLGTVAGIEGGVLYVRMDDSGETHEVAPVKWERFRYEWNKINEHIEAVEVGSYTQLPVRLAWASTIHKAQGLTLNDVRVDLAGGAFAGGQAYVALSRATSLAGLSFARPLTASDVILDKAVTTMLERMQAG